MASNWRSPGLWADTLTVSRMVLAAPLLVSAAAGAWAIVAMLLAVAWWSDLLDGRLARRSTEPTRFGHLDLTADTVAGAGLLLGLVVGGHVPVWLGAVGAALGAVAVALRNPAAAMLVQVCGYAPALWFAYSEAIAGFVVAVASILVIAALDIRRFVTYVLPTFFKGLLGRQDRVV